MHVLGIDAGGTKTVCLLADERGAIVSEGRGAGANLHTAGEHLNGQRVRDWQGPPLPTLSETAPVREAYTPWSIRVADVKTGKGREIWRAAPGAGISPVKTFR